MIGRGISLSVMLVLAIASPADARRRARAVAPPVPAPCLQFYLGGQAPVSASPGADERRFCHSFYVLNYATVRRDPVWTSYRMTRRMAETATRLTGRGGSFFRQQPGLGRTEQARDGDWAGTEFDKGHMVPDNDGTTRPRQADTYFVTNIVPQIPSFNGGLWKLLEGAVHNLAIKTGEVYIVTGPIFGAPRSPMHGVTVPSAIFKAIYVPSRNVAVAFIASNEFPSNCRIVTVAQVQRESGIEVFPSLSPTVTARPAPLPADWDGFPEGCTVH